MLLESTSSRASLWIFGYGSLIWNPGFAYAESRKAWAQGWKRRMWQGNANYRGDEKLPDRVATMVESRRSAASGVAFRVDGADAIDAALAHLNEREIEQGYAYKFVRVTVDDDGSSLLALTCIALPTNDFFLGRAPSSEMALQIGTARGKAGPNYEYVLKLAEHVRALFPTDDDPHLFGLERKVREILRSTVAQ